jgi:membrane-bound metal-dependent hydrolase YbcI (DUF457 family)
MSFALFHIIFVLPFFFILRKSTYYYLLIIGAIFPDLMALPFFLFTDDAIIQNIFTMLGVAFVVGLILSRFTKEISWIASALILYGGSVNHLLTDFLTHPDFSPFFPIHFSIMDGFANPINYFGWFTEWELIVLVMAILLFLQLGCFLLAKKYYYKKTESPIHNKMVECITLTDKAEQEQCLGELSKILEQGE